MQSREGAIQTKIRGAEKCSELPVGRCRNLTESYSDWLWRLWNKIWQVNGIIIFCFVLFVLLHYLNFSVEPEIKSKVRFLFPVFFLLLLLLLVANCLRENSFFCWKELTNESMSVNAPIYPQRTQHFVLMCFSKNDFVQQHFSLVLKVHIERDLRVNCYSGFHWIIYFLLFEMINHQNQMNCYAGIVFPTYFHVKAKLYKCLCRSCLRICWYS